MSTILKVTSSFRGEASASNQLSDAIVNQLKVKDATATVIERDLVKEEVPHLDLNILMSFVTPEADRSEEQQNIVNQSDEFIKEVMAADAIVIGVPMYNFTIPSVLKSWLDQIARAGVTFKYTAEGAVGLVEGKEVYLAIATGGIYSEGPAAAVDFTESYLKAVLGFMGMTNVTAFRAEGMNIPEFAEKAVPNALAKVEEYSF
ncbi:FMN-dependent NADH-azoreductase [Pustulibacterium marinum]|uniref:FMN dependent NADH:quinone oxidoreductase n=1 Tax=Pustulibacterium marinum TaxID=1224947 RepID=A0A1I7FB83_9FLAO|nr:FMN-dependent NADH-azoreductase [Pustulibacterium marinum]SFU33523.1 FMN-dependent NADH-azoreductase [Pustulibacterium marinum]